MILIKMIDLLPDFDFLFLKQLFYSFFFASNYINIEKNDASFSFALYYLNLSLSLLKCIKTLYIIVLILKKKSYLNV